MSCDRMRESAEEFERESDKN